MITQSVLVSLLSLGIIFLVLGILIGAIRLLDYFFPYVTPPPAPVKPRSQPMTQDADDDSEHVAVIHAALAHHLRRAPQEIHITNIQSH